jgi:DHA2 family multidrug resistance protein
MHMHAGPAKASLRAYALVNGELNRQAQSWAYIDVLRYLAMACAACVPVVFVLKKCKHKPHAHVTC